MKVLIVASYNKGRFAPFIEEQVKALEMQGCAIRFFGLQGKGIKGYIKNLPLLRKEIKVFQPDVIHAHYGLSGLFANMQRRVPVVTTYHGSDINDKKALRFSKIALRLSKWNIFVSKQTLEVAKPKERYALLPCGVDLSDLQLTDKAEARRQMHLGLDKKYVLFAGAFDNQVKNAPLAKRAVENLHNEDVELLELKGYSREEVALLMCAADALIMTSFSEGSPQVIKEALACGCPIVSVDVGDVKDRVDGVEGCYVSDSREPKELAVLLCKAMLYEGKTKGREKLYVDELDNKQVAEKVVNVYKRVIAK